MTNIVSAVLFIFFLIGSCTFHGIIVGAGSNIIRVPQDYATIQGAVNAANAGDTIMVSAGDYNEYIYVNKSLKIIGEGAESTVVHTIEDGYTFEVQADDVTISGFTIHHVVVSCVYLYNSNRCNISYNVMDGTWYTIGLFNSSHNFIGDNEITPTSNGVGISLLVSDNNVVAGNTVSGAREGVGIDIIGCDNLIENNHVFDCYGGIWPRGSPNTTIRGNTIEGIPSAMWVCGPLNRVYHNNFIHSQQIGGVEGNVWDNGVEGNYWDDYNGTDLNGDGVGDTFLPWRGVDYYPLMSPWHPILGDLNDDGIVNILDVVVVASCYGAKPNDSSWNPLADLAPPCGVIDILDIVTLTSHYGLAWWKST